MRFGFGVIYDVFYQLAKVLDEVHDLYATAKKLLDGRNGVVCTRFRDLQAIASRLHIDPVTCTPNHMNDFSPSFVVAPDNAPSHPSRN